MDDEDQRVVDKTLHLTPEQQQLLEQENEHLASHLASTLDQVRLVWRSRPLNNNNTGINNMRAGLEWPSERF